MWYSVIVNESCLFLKGDENMKKQKPAVNISKLTQAITQNFFSKKTNNNFYFCEDCGDKVGITLNTHVVYYVDKNQFILDIKKMIHNKNMNLLKSLYKDNQDNFDNLNTVINTKEEKSLEDGRTLLILEIEDTKKKMVIDTNYIGMFDFDNLVLKTEGIHNGVYLYTENKNLVGIIMPVYDNTLNE